MRKLSLTAALNEALHEEFERDRRVFIMGIDVALGTFGRTKGLAARFGVERVRDTPISELGFLGAGVGAAAAGGRPIVDVQITNFLYVCFDALANQAGKLRYMTGGAAAFPLTVIASTGSPGLVAAQHADVPAAQIMNAGGIKVVFPSTPADAKGLLKAAIRDPNPVVFLVHFAMGGVRGEVPDGELLIPIGSARQARDGEDVTVVAWGAMAPKALAAADLLADEISIEVIDPRTLFPLDRAAIVRSVSKTGRLVVVDEARQTCSAGRDIIAQISEVAFDSLRAAPRLVANPDVHIPYAAELEREVVPQVEDIVAAVRATTAAAVIVS